MFLKPLGIAQYRLAKAIGVASTRFDLDRALEARGAELDRIPVLVFTGSAVRAVRRAAGGQAGTAAMF